MLTHKYSHSPRGFCPACAGSLALASSQSTRDESVHAHRCGNLRLYFMRFFGFAVEGRFWIQPLLLCTDDRSDFVFVCVRSLLLRRRVCEGAPRTYSSVLICRDAGERHSCSGRGRVRLWACACISKTLCAEVTCTECTFESSRVPLALAISKYCFSFGGSLHVKQSLMSNKFLVMLSRSKTLQEEKNYTNYSHLHLSEISQSFISSCVSFKFNIILGLQFFITQTLKKK